MIFEPDILRKQYDRHLLDFVLRTKYDPSAPMGNVAIHELDDVVTAWLIGLHDQVSPVIPRCLRWLEQAIDEDEQLHELPDFHRGELQRGKALALWMLRGENAVEVWDKALHFSSIGLAHDEKILSPARISRVLLDDHMMFCFQAEQYETGIADFEKYLDKKAVLPSKIRTPRELGYAFCLQQLRPQFDPDDLFAAGRRMLRLKLEEDWLGCGQTDRAATWLKIIYWHRNPELTPLQTVLHAYDNMPNVPRPDFL